MVNDKDIASDIVQEVFIYLYQKMEKGVYIQFPKSWLYRATVNKCIDESRRKTKFLKIEDSNIEEKADNDNNAEKHEAIHKALSKLTAKERSLAILYSEGLNYKEMAEITGIKNTSVGKTLARTLEKLGNYLKINQDELH